MIKKKTIRLAFVLIASISFITCVEDGDFTVPEILGVEENIAVNAILDSISTGTLELKTIKQDIKIIILH